MKVKTNLKIVLMIVLFAMLLIGTTKVNAVEVTEEYLQNMLDVLPSEMYLDISEVEYEKVGNIITENIKNILKEHNIAYEEIEERIKIKDVTINGLDIEISTYGSVLYLNKDNFYNTEVYIQATKDNTIYSNYTKSKTVKLIYNNTKNYNSADEQIVKNLKLPTPPKYFTYDFNEALANQNGNLGNMILKNISNYYQSKNNDTTIKFIADSGAWGDTVIDFGFHGISLGIFKNDILYDSRYLTIIPVVCQMTVPSNVGDTDEDYINYATPIIKDYCKEVYETNNITLIKGAKTDESTYYKPIEIENGYTIKSNGEEIGRIILKKEKSNTPTVPTTPTTPTVEQVTKEDKETNIKLSTSTSVVPQNTVLIAKEQKEEKVVNVVKESLKDITSKFKIYDITLMSDNKVIQPNGNVKISLPIPEGYDKTKLEIYRIEENGEKTKYDVKVEDNYATFETNHFSNYVLAEKTTNATSNNNQEQNNNNTSNNNQNNSNRELDETPKTGTIDTIKYIMPVMIISAVGIIALRKKINQ